jgi:predicted RNA-binding Zn ribbon-like protein
MHAHVLQGPVRPELSDSLDFINTLAHDRDGDTEHLATPEAAEAWLTTHGARAPLHLSDTDLVTVRSTRQAMRELADAVVQQRAPSAEALDRLNGLLALGDRPRLVLVDDSVAVAAAHAHDPLQDALTHLVEPLVDLVEHGDPARLRTCDDETCRWVFYDESRTARRRWCDMSTCGNRAKAARHRARLRGAGDTAGRATA